MCFSSGLTSYCVYPFITPGTFVIVARPTVEVALETIARFVLNGWDIRAVIFTFTRYQVTIARFQPSFIRRILNYSRLKDAKLSSLQLVISSGSYFSAELLAKLAVTIPHKFYFVQSMCLCLFRI